MRLDDSELDAIDERGYANGLTGARCARMSDNAAADVPALVAELRAERASSDRLRTALAAIVGWYDNADDEHVESRFGALMPLFLAARAALADSEEH